MPISSPVTSSIERRDQETALRERAATAGEGQFIRPIRLRANLSRPQNHEFITVTV